MNKKSIDNRCSFRIKNEETLKQFVKINNELHHSNMTKTLNYLLEIGIETYNKNNHPTQKKEDISAVELKKLQQLQQNDINKGYAEIFYNTVEFEILLNTRLYNILLDHTKGLDFDEALMENGSYDIIPDCINKDNLY